MRAKREKNKMSKSIGEMMESQDGNGWGKLAGILGYLIYLGGIVYATAHNLSLFPGTLPTDLKIWAYMSVLILALNAIALPLGIHNAFAQGGQREAALVFYGLDIVTAIANVIVDSMINRGSLQQGFEKFYFDYVVVAIPVVFGLIAWSVIWMLDPQKTLRDAISSARSASVKSLAEKIKGAAQSVGNDSIDDAAEQIARAVAGQVAGDGVHKATSGKGTKQPARAIGFAAAREDKQLGYQVDDIVSAVMDRLAQQQLQPPRAPVKRGVAKASAPTKDDETELPNA